MKSLFFVSVAVGILSGTTISAGAQTSISIERLGRQSQPRFIENIELKRAALPANAVAVSNTVMPQPVAKPMATVKKEFSAAIENCTPLQFKYAQLMDIEVEAVNNPDLFNFIDEWWAVRYRYGGTTKRGVDCSSYTGQLVQAVYGLSLPRTAREQYRVTQHISREELAEGDLVFFNTRGGVSHVGVYLGNNRFTHSSSHSGVTINSLDEAYYSKRFIGAGRVTGETILTEATALAE